MDAKLVVVAGEAKQGEYKLHLPAVIGRSRKSDLMLGHPLVSRQHCELYEAEGVLMVRDLGSLNGTFVGDARITEETTLDPGALLTVGTVTFKAVYGSAQQKPAPRAPKKAAVAAEPAGADVQQTLQADGLAALDQLRESHAAPPPLDEDELVDVEELDWPEEGEAAAEEPLVELEPVEEIKTFEADEFTVSEAEEAPLLVDDLDTMPVEPAAAEGVGITPPDKEKAAKPADPDDLDDFFKSLG